MPKEGPAGRLLKYVATGRARVAGLLVLLQLPYQWPFLAFFNYDKPRVLGLPLFFVYVYLWYTVLLVVLFLVSRRPIVTGGQFASRDGWTRGGAKQ